MDDAASSSDARIVVVDADDHPLLAAQEVWVEMGDILKKSTERFESDVSMMQTRIPRFPHHLRGIGGEGDRYVVPSVVAIGPYHRHLPHLQPMEKVKLAAVYNFCRASGRSLEEVHRKVLSVAGEARRCYDASVVSGLSDAKFVAMMLLDGCFLLRYLDGGDPLLWGCHLSAEPNFYRDVFLLENQIPWLVLEALRASATI